MPPSNKYSKWWILLCSVLFSFFPYDRCRWTGKWENNQQQERCIQYVKESTGNCSNTGKLLQKRRVEGQILNQTWDFWIFDLPYIYKIPLFYLNMNTSGNTCYYDAENTVIACVTILGISRHSDQKGFTQVVKTCFQCVEHFKAVFYIRNLPKRW